MCDVHKVKMRLTSASQKVILRVFLIAGPKQNLYGIHHTRFLIRTNYIRT